MTDQERKAIEMALEALFEAQDEIREWGGYAPDYFQKKHDLLGSIAKLQPVINTLRTALAQDHGFDRTASHMTGEYVDASDTSSTCVDENEKREHEGCAECGKKASDGWALYCVKCTELFKPDWDMIEPYHERIKELEIENEKLRQELAKHKEQA